MLASCARIASTTARDFTPPEKRFADPRMGHPLLRTPNPTKHASGEK